MSSAPGSRAKISRRTTVPSPPLLDPTRKKLAAVRKVIEDYPKTSLVMRELPEPRQTHIHVRGAFLSLGEKVTPAVPSLFGQTPTTARATRPGPGQVAGE